jgi:hypothetical protein
MNKKEKINPKDFRKQDYETKKMNSSRNNKNMIDKKLPWWVELLFVQIGLPDSFLIKILRAKKKTKELVNINKKSLLIFFFVIATLGYFYPVIRHAQNKLNCETIAKKYITKNKNIVLLNKKELKMLSTNFCYGGEEIYEIESLRN